MNRSWGTVGAAMLAVIVIGVTGCGVAGATGLEGDQPLAVIPQPTAGAPATPIGVIAAQEQPSPSDERVDEDAVEENGDSIGFHHGGPAEMHGRRHGPHRWMLGMLDLTDDQRQQARDVRVQMRDDVKAVHDAARDEIHALLTEEQLAQIEALRAERAEAREQRQGEGHRGERHHGHGVPGQGTHRFGGPPRDGHRAFDSLDLTEQQQIAIDAIRDATHEDIRALHDTARDAVRAILTPEQIEILDELHPPKDDQLEQPEPEVDG